jgi:hypothetical protein
MFHLRAQRTGDELALPPLFREPSLNLWLYA